MTTENSRADALTDEHLTMLKQAARAATPQDIDGAERIENRPDGSYITCPACEGEGCIPFESDYCNYDHVAIGVQFYGIGAEPGAAEAYFRAAKPATILALLDRLERAESALAASPVEQPASAPIDTPTDREFALSAAICVHPKGVYGDEGGSMCCPITHTRDASFAPAPADERAPLTMALNPNAPPLTMTLGPAQAAEPVAWAVYNGWSRICFYMTEEDARDHAQKAQKNHDLSGSLAAFRVVPLYAAPQPPAQAVELVAQWQARLKDRSSPVVDHWVNISPDGAKQLMEKYADIYEVRALYAAPQPPAQADARERLTDALRRAREELSIVEWENDPPARVTDLLSTIDALIHGAKQ